VSSILTTFNFDNNNTKKFNENMNLPDFRNKGVEMPDSGGGVFGYILPGVDRVS
jgi:hypothetical protein